MNLSTPTSLENKTKFLKSRIDQIYQTVSKKQPQQQKPNQILRIQFISFLDDTIDKIEAINAPQSQRNFKSTSFKSTSNNDEYKQRYFQAERQRIQLEKKITQLLEKQIRQQEHALKLQRAQSQSLKQKNKLQGTIKQLNSKIQKLNADLYYSSTKIKDQDKEMHRLITLNHKLNEQKEKITEQRFRAEKRLNELQQKYEGDEVALHTKNAQGQKFNLRNTEGIRHIRILTNASGQKKNQQKYFILELPARIQVQKIVYGIRIGILNVNKEIVYFNELFMYEKDPMKLQMQGDHLSVEFQKRKERLVIDKHKLLKPQVLILLYGKGDSVMIDETK